MGVVKEVGAEGMYGAAGVVKEVGAEGMYGAAGMVKEVGAEGMIYAICYPRTVCISYNTPSSDLARASCIYTSQITKKGCYK